MKLLVARALMAISTVVLLSLVAITVQWSRWSNEKSLVSWPQINLPISLATSASVVVTDPLQPLSDMYAAYTLPEAVGVVEKKVASRPAVRHYPSVKFQSVSKEINILDEVLAPEESEVQGEWKQLQGATELPKIDTMESAPVIVADLAETKLVALMDNLVLPAKADQPQTVVAEAKPEILTDTVSTTLAKANDVKTEEPEFFEYQPEPTKTLGAPEVEKVDEAPLAAQAPADEYSLPPEVNSPSPPPVTTQKLASSEDEELVAFNYATTLPYEQVVKQSPKVSQVDTHAIPRRRIPVDRQEILPPKPAPPTPPTPPTPEPDNKRRVVFDARAVVAPLSVSVKVSPLTQYDLKSMDDGKILNPNKEGKVYISETVSSRNNSRTFEIFQPGHASTYVDIPLVPGFGENYGDIEVPVFEQDKMAEFATKPTSHPLGYYLVELDDETEAVDIDGIPTKSVRLDSNFKVTQSDDYSYLLFTGVEVGNRTASFKRNDGKISRKFVHIHEESVTYDMNIYNPAGDTVITLKEQDILGLKRKDLVISGEQVASAVGNETAQKIAPAVYRMKLPPLTLGSRNYLSLGHQGEEIFLGVDKSGEATVPSEAFMREVIKRFKLDGSAEACVVQVNLDKPVKQYEVLPESYNESHVSYALVLDEDGKFYESMGENSSHLFIMSGTQQSEEITKNSKINIRLQYQDGSTRSFSSFCSPNSYLVEQL